MKKSLFFTLLLVLCMFASFACKKKELPLEISQEEFASKKEYVELKTGIKMAYVEMGDPDGEVVILQHGTTDNARSWSLVAPYFAKKGYHVFMPDLRGQGKTDVVDGYYTIFTYANDLEAFFEAKNIDKAIVVGHSLGSFVVQTFMLMFPEKCNKVVLVSSVPLRGILNKSLRKIYDGVVEPLDDDGHVSDDFINTWYESKCLEEKYANVFPTFISFMKKEAQSLTKKSWKNVILGMIGCNLIDLYFTYEKNIPILLLHGELDNMTKTEFQQELMDCLSIPKENYIAYNNVGHNIQFEIPERCANDMLTWLEK